MSEHEVRPQEEQTLPASDYQGVTRLSPQNQDNTSTVLTPSSPSAQNSNASASSDGDNRQNQTADTASAADSDLNFDSQVNNMETHVSNDQQSMAHADAEHTLKEAEAAAAVAVAAAQKAVQAVAAAAAVVGTTASANGGTGSVGPGSTDDVADLEQAVPGPIPAAGQVPAAGLASETAAGTNPVVLAAAVTASADNEVPVKSEVATSGLDYKYDGETTGPVRAFSGSGADNGDSKEGKVSAADPDRNILHGNPASRGIAVGRISFLKRNAPQSSRIEITDVEAEVERFERARSEAIAQLGSLYEVTVEKLGEQNAVVFQIHQMMLDDPDYVEAIESTIREEKTNAEYAVEVTGQRFSDMFSNMDNDYMRGRATDVIDVSRRLNDILNTHAGTKTPHHYVQANEPILLATDDLSPSETVQLDQDLVRGIITSEGSSRSHTVIFARTLGLPAVINIGSKLNEELEGTMAIVDGGAGIIILDPDEKTLATYAERKRTEDALRARLEQFRGKETRTLSGRKISLYANIGAVSDLDLVKTSDAEGIGLFRSEYIYLSSSDYPSEETQFNIYKETLIAMEGKKVVIRTLDIGADKTADYFMLKHEENPAMGMRAVRICLSRPEIFKTQLRALYRASVYGSLAIMFPMISSVEEVKECIRICNEVKDELTSRGEPFSPNVELGIMIETPASAIISDLLSEYVDFFSIGTNDLTQFTLAVDRQNAEVGRFLNPYHRAVIRLIEMTVNNAHKNGLWVGVCGELAADEGFTHELVRMGVDEISVVPSSILMLRARISTLG